MRQHTKTTGTMKQQTRFFFLTAALLLTGIGAATAQNGPEPKPRIQVTGTATITLAPDELTMSISIRQQNPDAKKTVEAYRSTREGVLKALRDARVGDTNITEMGLAFSKQVERNYETGKIIKEYYLATTTINIVLRKFDSYPELVVALTNLPGVELGYVNYRSSREIETRQKARIQAVESAKKKATDMAAVCGAKIGEPLLITENNPTPYMPVQSNRRFGEFDREEAETSLVVASDAIQITVSVYVEFALE